ncbi:MAG TPA: ion channel [Flavisolibacter sp.]|nr:ion channel [Flavisolibacter sp.]
MSSRKINPFLKSNPDTGFGVQPSQIGGRFVNKDGSFNLSKEGWPWWRRISIYSKLLALSSPQFFLLILSFFLVVNLMFTCLYMLVGIDQIKGLVATTEWGKVKEIFFFSTQTFTTVGYGRVNPVGDEADLIASLESLTGLLSFAVFTGLLYGRFSRPKAYLAFSEQALIAPYGNGRALMFRIVPYKSNHHLTNAQVMVTITFEVNEDGKSEYKFYSLKLERSRIDTFNMNWTVVHPIDEDSPLLHFSKEDFQKTDLELYVLVSGFDQVFSNTVMQRTSYTSSEMIWGAKFKPMYHESADGSTTVLELDKLDHFEKVELQENIIV